MKNRNMILRICACALVMLMLAAALSSCSGGGKTFFERYLGGDSSNEQPYYPNTNIPNTNTPSGTETCNHNWVEEYIIQEATPSTDGIKRFRCSRCYVETTEYYSLGALTGEEIYELGERSFCEITSMSRSGEVISVGSGFVYNENGEILTNYHVIDGAYQISVVVCGNKYTVRDIIYFDEYKDVALLRIDAYGLDAVDVNADSPKAGSTVYSIGNPLNYGISITGGVVSYSSRYIDGYCYIQHDSAISGGNSGGPLYNEYGEVIGMNTMTDYDGQNLNFAIPMYEIVSYIDYSNSMSVTDHYDRYTTPVSLLYQFAVNYGNYDGNFYTAYLGCDYYSDSYNSSYYYRYVKVDPYDSSCIMLVTSFDENEFVLYITENSSTYNWHLDRADGYYMDGYVYPDTFSSGTSVLPYNSYNSDPSNSRRMAASALRAILISMTTDLNYYCDVVPADLGFINF